MHPVRPGPHGPARSAPVRRKGRGPREAAMPGSPAKDSTAALTRWLKDQHAAVCACERQALDALHERKDESAYRKGMLDKARMLAALEREAEDLVKALPEEIRDRVRADLSSFSAGARMSITLDSVFYMSALLYPDDHKPGDPDNLQLLIASLEQP